MNLTLYPLIPIWLLLPLLALTLYATFAAFRHRNPLVTQPQHHLLVTLRLLALLALFLLLLCPGRITEERNLDSSHIVFLLDHSASMSVADMEHGATRLSHAANFISETHLHHIRDYPQAWYAFNNTTTNLATPTAATTLTPHGGTDLKQAIAAIERDIGLNHVSALVLLSDGLDHSEAKGSEITPPILSLQIGTDLTSAPDLAIEPFNYPARVNTGTQINLEIPLLLHGYTSDQTLPFTLTHNNHPLHSSTITLTPARPHILKITTTLEEPGLHLFTATLPPLPNEATTLNNQRHFAIEAVTPNDSILAYFPLLNTAMRPLIREFMKDETTHFTALYRLSDHAFRIAGHSPDPALSQGLPHNATHLKQYAALILGAHNRELLTPAEALTIEQYVSQGGSLIALGGADAFGSIPPDSPLNRLLPLVTLENSFLTGTWHLTPDPHTDHAFAAQLENLIATNPDPDQLTISGINQIAETKPGAHTLLWASGDSRHPLLVSHSYGRGKVFALLTNTLHLWGAPDKRDANFSALWRQLIAQAQNPDDHHDLLQISLHKHEVSPLEPIQLTAIAHLPPGISNQTITVTADLFPASSDTPIDTLTLTPRQHDFHGTLKAEQPGTYILRVTSTADNTPLRTRYHPVICGTSNLENENLRSSPELFHGLSSPNHIFTISDTTPLQNALLTLLRRNITQREHYPLLETPTLLIIITILLLSEWYLRRRFNLF